MTRVGALARLLILILLAWNDGGRCVAADAPPPFALTESLSIGGEARERFEAYRNEFFSTASDADNAYFLQRYLLHADYRPTPWLRLFGELQSSLEHGRPGGPRPTDRDVIDVHQLFADVTVTTPRAERLTLRLGRQELSFGSERLVGVREGTNNRRAFDAARLLYRRPGLDLDAFFAGPVEVDRGAFDDAPIDDVWLWGVYATLPGLFRERVGLDAYYLGLANPQAVFAQGTGREERQTVGVRLFGALGPWDVNHEALYQFGRFADADITAWSVATDHGYTVDRLWSRPRLGLKAAIASGDDRAERQGLQTLNPLFPRGNYFTEAALLGPQNFFDAHPCLRFTPLPPVFVDLGADFYWRTSRGDGIYGPSGVPIFAGDTSRARFVGTDLSVVASWQAHRSVVLSAAYTHFFAGPFIRENDGVDVDYGAVWASLRF